MKKGLVFIMLLCFVFTAKAQFKIGVNGGVPVGDYSDFYKFNVGVDAYYMFRDPDKFFNLGAAAGFINYFGDEVDVLGTTVEYDNAQFIPVAAAARFTLFSLLTFGPDIGYGIGLNEGMDGGFYWRSVLGLDFGNRLEIDTFYQSISVDGTTLGSIGAGLLIEF